MEQERREMSISTSSIYFFKGVKKKLTNKTLLGDLEGRGDNFLLVSKVVWEQHVKVG